MNWFKRKKSTTIPTTLIIHDPSCPQGPCLCLALREERLERTRTENARQRVQNALLAKQILDAENPVKARLNAIYTALDANDHNLARRMAGITEPSLATKSGIECSRCENGVPCYECLDEAIQRVRELHKPRSEKVYQTKTTCYPDGTRIEIDEDVTVCDWCQYFVDFQKDYSYGVAAYPCPTIKALDGEQE